MYALFLMKNVYFRFALSTATALTLSRCELVLKRSNLGLASRPLLFCSSLFAKSFRLDTGRIMQHVGRTGDELSKRRNVLFPHRNKHIHFTVST